MDSPTTGRCQHAVYRVDGVECTGLVETGVALEDCRGRAVSRRAAHDRCIDEFLDRVQPAEMPAAWHWERGRIREVAARAKNKALGVDGLCYAVWARTTEKVLRQKNTSVPDDLACAAAGGSVLPTAMHDSCTAHITKSELLADTSGGCPIAVTLRPLTLMGTSKFLIALYVVFTASVGGFADIGFPSSLRSIDELAAPATELCRVTPATA